MAELPNIVRERLKASAPVSAHPDADLLTAFAEHSLPDAERAVVMEHLARCHDCRDILSLALPATVTVETVRVPLPVRHGGFADWLANMFGAPALRWGVVLAGCAVLTLAGILQYQRRQTENFIAARRTQAPSSQTTTDQVSRDEESAKPTAEVPSATADSASAPLTEASRLSAGRAKTKEAEDAFAKEGLAEANSARGTVSPSATSTAQAPQLTAALPAPASAYGGVIAAPNKQNAQFAARAMPAAPVTVEAQAQTLTANERVEVANQPPQNQPYQLDAKNQLKDETAAGIRPSSMDATVDKAKAPSATTTVEVSAAPLIETESAALTTPAMLRASRWTISATGGLQRSFDQGKTWANVDVNANQSAGANLVALESVPQNKKSEQTAQNMARQQMQSQAQNIPSKNQSVSSQKAPDASASTPVFRAVSASGLEVWAGGSAGVLYHSSDGGQQWTRIVPFAFGTSLTGDIVGIAFTDPQHGKIQTSTFELWTTADGGQTWHKP
jgi:hypothetical protein